MTDDPLMTGEEAGELLQRSPATVRRERIEGRLGFVQIRGRYFYKLS